MGHGWQQNWNSAGGICFTRHILFLRQKKGKSDDVLPHGMLNNVPILKVCTYSSSEPFPIVSVYIFTGKATNNFMARSSDPEVCKILHKKYSMWFRWDIICCCLCAHYCLKITWKACEYTHLCHSKHFSWMCFIFYVSCHGTLLTVLHYIPYTLRFRSFL